MYGDHNEAVMRFDCSINKHLLHYGTTATDMRGFNGLSTAAWQLCCSAYLAISYSWLPSTGNLLGCIHGPVSW
jgi:hypothetical protein